MTISKRCDVPSCFLFVVVAGVCVCVCVLGKMVGCVLQRHTERDGIRPASLGGGVRESSLPMLFSDYII